MKERKKTTEGRDGRTTARRHHTGILRRGGVWCTSRRPAFMPPRGRPTFDCKKRKKTDNQAPREGWEDHGTPPPHRDFKERGVVH